MTIGDFFHVGVRRLAAALADLDVPTLAKSGGKPPHSKCLAFHSV